MRFLLTLSRQTEKRFIAHRRSDGSESLKTNSILDRTGQIPVKSIVCNQSRLQKCVDELNRLCYSPAE